ncbi:deaminase [Leptolinea sp. HRD-7]|nr:deaminase [Leptolinea sp. HRD-7]
MGRLVYTTNLSLDGYIEDEHGAFDWSEPQEELHNFFKSMEERTPLTLYGRKLYETMAVWESEEWLKDLPAYIQDFGRVWRKTQKIVYSRTLTSVTTGNTALRHEFDPAEVQRLKDKTDGDICIGGAELAGVAMSHRLVDEVNLFFHPVIVGGGKPAFLSGIFGRLNHQESRVFHGGVIFTRYSFM